MGSTRRPALALAHPQAPHLSLRLGRAPLLLAGLACVLGLLYLAARETSLFAVRSVAVRGAPDEVARAVRAALEPLLGRSLVAVRTGDVERRLRALPSVRNATVDRDFPSTLRVDILPERPVAVLRRGGGAWLVSATGRVIREVEVGAATHLARIWLPAAGEQPLTPGIVLADEQGGAAVRAAAAVPSGFPGHVQVARGTVDSLTLVLGAKTELRLGEASDLRLKLAVAATVLRSLSVSERTGLAYLDVSLPDRPVAAPKPQVES